MILRRRQRRPSAFEQGPRKNAEALPAVSVVVAGMLALIPAMSTTGWWPDFGLMALIAWRLQRSDPFPNWAAIPLGLFNDLITLHPLGLSVVCFTIALIVLDVMDARRIRGTFFTDWFVAILLISIAEFIQLWIAAIQGAAMPLNVIIAPIVISSLLFPVMAGIVAMLDRYRLRK
ncbi:rod shape-determining protein MreD [Sphingomicrobium sp. XHP0239]|uniref:rod shape-determining protein MreD n=1 Tax=Sphingomicrobium maritimum TaxID=3133972 RepID=UPI0031CC4665